jgi:hypothetical protein
VGRETYVRYQNRRLKIRSGATPGIEFQKATLVLKLTRTSLFIDRAGDESLLSNKDAVGPWLITSCFFYETG